MLFGQIKVAQEYYHGSPTANLTSLRPGSYVTPDRATAELMGRYHLDTGKTWTDDDLAAPHYFGKAPQWKREPKGIPTIYKMRIADKYLNKLNNPYEHTTTSEIRL